LVAVVLILLFWKKRSKLLSFFREIIHSLEGMIAVFTLDGGISLGASAGFDRGTYENSYVDIIFDFDL
jgi:hypothetical protein